ncbi:MAG: alkaline phosphatase D family protein [Bacteroidota bacterium]
MKLPIALYLTILTGILTLNSCQSKKQLFSSADTGVQVIAFGSCNKPGIDGAMWTAISKNNPDMFVWLGDIVYGDTHDMDILKQKYQELSDLPAYKDFADETPIIGVWDDHDYGINDGGKYYNQKEASKEVLLNFLQVSEDSKMRQRPGAYSSTVLGSNDRFIKILLLDGRSFRDTLVHSTIKGRRYEANPEGDILGEAQWAWLEKELTNSDAKVHIIGCGIQFIAEEHGWEKWANFPKARQRFFDLMAKTKAANIVLVSGDRHIAELSKIDVAGLNQPIYDLTSSGITHTWSTIWEEPNKHRVGDLIIKRNFGLVKVKWDQKNNPSITLEVRGLENELFLAKDL